MDGRSTFNLLGIVDDEIAVPYDGEVHRQVTDLHTLVHVLKKQKQRVRECRKWRQSGRKKSQSQTEERVKTKKRNDTEKDRVGGR